MDIYKLHPSTGRKIFQEMGPIVRDAEYNGRKIMAEKPNPEEANQGGTSLTSLKNVNPTSERGIQEDIDMLHPAIGKEVLSENPVLMQASRRGVLKARSSNSYKRTKTRNKGYKTHNKKGAVHNFLNKLMNR